MPMQDWIHKYPGVERLLQGDEELLYNTDAEWQPPGLLDAAYLTGTTGGELTVLVQDEGIPCFSLRVDIDPDGE